MANDPEPPEYGTLVVAIVLITTILFAGYWIMQYAQTGSRPWNLVTQFVITAAVILALGLIGYLRRR